MHVPALFHQINYLICFFLGYTTNGALLWLISYRTEEDARPFSPILLLSAIVDLAYLAVILVVEPVLAIDNGLATIISVGPLGWVPQPYNFALAGTWTFFLIFSICSLCVPFVYRYAVICRNKKKYGLREFLLMLSVPFVFSLAYIGTCFYAGYPWTEADQQRGRERFSNETETLAAGDPKHSPYVVGYSAIDEAHNNKVAMNSTVLITISYTLIFTCGWRIYSHLKQETSNLSEARSRQVNRQVSRALLLQALVPLVAQTLPATAITVAAVAGLQVGNVSVYGAAVLAWTPVVNPLIPMWVVRAYRTELAKWFCRWRQPQQQGGSRMVGNSTQQQLPSLRQSSTNRVGVVQAQQPPQQPQQPPQQPQQPQPNIVVVQGPAGGRIAQRGWAEFEIPAPNNTQAQ